MIVKTLKPCPFCGGKVEIIENQIELDYQSYNIQCENPDCFLRWGTGNIYFNFEKLIRDWNKRAQCI